MKTLTALAVVALSLLLLAGCATRGEVALQNANPDAYDATRGGHSPAGPGGGGFGGSDE